MNRALVLDVCGLVVDGSGMIMFAFRSWWLVVVRSRETRRVLVLCRVRSIFMCGDRHTDRTDRETARHTHRQRLRQRLRLRLRLRLRHRLRQTKSEAEETGIKRHNGDRDKHKHRQSRDREREPETDRDPDRDREKT